MVANKVQLRSDAKLHEGLNIHLELALFLTAAFGLLLYLDFVLEFLYRKRKGYCGIELT